MNHMPDTGIKGIDLYYKTNNGWQYLATGRPQGFKNEYNLIQNMTNEEREYKIYLPLYDGIKNIEIGIDDNSFIRKGNKIFQNTIVFYGTSITQGGCASRPGMAHTNIISRKIDKDVINFGFSGNGRMEQPIAELISRMKPLFYVIECMPNINAEIVKKNTRPLIKEIRKNLYKHSAPIIFFEECLTNLSNLDQKLNNQAREKNFELKKQIDIAKDKGEKNIHIIKQDGCFDHGSEFTVDGVHFNDLGFHRYAFHFIENIKKLNLLD